MYVWGGAIKIGARPFWGRGVFVLVISNINIGYQKSLTPPLIDILWGGEGFSSQDSLTLLLRLARLAMSSSRQSAPWRDAAVKCSGRSPSHSPDWHQRLLRSAHSPTTSCPLKHARCRAEFPYAFGSLIWRQRHRSHGQRCFFIQLTGFLVIMMSRRSQSKPCKYSQIKLFKWQ